MAALPHLISVEQFRQLPEGELLYELHHGEVVALTRPRARHWKLQLRLSRLLEPRLKDFGEVATEVPYRPLAEFELRAADVAAISRARWDAIDPDDNLHGAPELAIEVKSPSNTERQLRELVAPPPEQRRARMLDRGRRREVRHGDPPGGRGGVCRRRQHLSISLRRRRAGGRRNLRLTSPIFLAAAVPLPETPRYAEDARKTSGCLCTAARSMAFSTSGEPFGLSPVNRGVHGGPPAGVARTPCAQFSIVCRTWRDWHAACFIGLRNRERG